MATATSLPSKLPPWPRLSYALAMHLVKNDIPRTFLTSAEEEHLNTALVSFQQWQSFIEPKIDATKPDHQFTSSQLTAFRVRTLLSEQFIPHFFHKDARHRPCCQNSKLNIDKLCLEAKEVNDNHETTIARLDIPENQVSKTDTMPLITFKAEGQHDEQQKRTTQNSDHIPLLDIFHTVEFDKAAMVEQRKLEESQAQEERLNEEKNKNSNSNSVVASLLFEDSDQSNLKYLLKGIAENRHKTTLTDRELRNLLLEVKPHRSKWANDDKAGQEDLYEACEKMLTDLKNYTEHSTPFITKVSKRDAPDYFEVIKEPMDLGTVSKKLKAFQYKNKKEFARDLHLIFQNCLDYNTDPHSEYRKHAIAMRRKTDRLLPRVPDISIKERFGDDVDDYMDMSDEELTECANPPIKLTLNRERSASRASRERSMTVDSVADEGLHANYAGKYPKKGAAHPQTAIDTAHEEQSTDSEIEADKGELQNTMWRAVTKKTRAKVMMDIEKQYQFDFGNRHAITKSPLDMERLDLMEHLHHQPESTNKLIRCSRIEFSRWLERHEGMRVYNDFDLNSEDEDGYDSGFFFSRESNRPRPTDKDDAMRNDLFLPEYSTTPGLPEIEGVPGVIEGVDEYYSDQEADEEEKKQSSPTLDMYVATRRPEKGLGTLMDNNIKALQNIRSIYKMCNSIHNNNPIGESSDAYSSLANDDDSEADETKPTSAPLNEIAASIPSSSSSSSSDFSSIEINQETNQQLMQRTIIQLLTHAGFEGAQGGPLNVMTELMSEYFSNIGKTLKSYCDTHGHDMTGEEILLHSLHENGVDQLDDLVGYVTDDVEKYGHRLRDVNRRLESTYQDLVAGSTKETLHNESDLFEDDDAFTTGLFGDELGPDFFGFKKIGLDQEYNATLLQIPPKLWFGNDEPKLKKLVQSKTQEEPPLKYPFPPAFTPAKDEDSFIGLLKPWYKRRIHDNPSAVEDEFKSARRSNRPKNPPIHLRSANSIHISQSKRKALKDGSNTIHSLALMEEKKKRKILLEESKAEKKKQKLDLKAQKLAEREQKKKIREENRLAKQQKEKK
ncbi:hypothetical protein BD408DRAFT_412817 [Parasitella parasitica]|nr:hypothetical protein BD408DRAFT_412817 [Parasitella parasitica]